MAIPKIVTYISNRKEEFTAKVIGDRGKECLNLEIKRPGGRTQRILNVPKIDNRDKHPKFCWYDKSDTKTKTPQEPEKSKPKTKPSQESEN